MSAAPAKHRLFPIILTALIDMLGIGIIIPVIAPLIVDNTGGILDPASTEAQRNIVYGFLAALYPIMQFFGAPVLGALSDRYGRKKILYISLGGSAIGFALFAIGVLTQNLWLLFLSRGLDGFTGGNISIIYSAISDISGPKDRAKNFGLVGMALGFGFVVGPLLGGVLADPTLVSWFSPSTPFWFAAGLCVFNMLLLTFIFKETLAKVNPRPVTILTGFRNFTKAFTFPNLRTIFTVVFFGTLGFSFFTQFFSVFMIERHGFAERDLGLYFGFIGVCIAFTQGVLVRIFTKRFQPTTIIPFTSLGLAIALPMMLLPTSEGWLYAISPLVAIFHGLTLPNLNALVSMQASADQQGQVMGINQSVSSIGNAIPPILAGFLSATSIYLPTLAAGLFTFFSWVFFVIFFKIRKKVQD